MIAEIFAVVGSMFEILIQNFSILLCATGQTMSRRAHRVGIPRLSVFLVQLRGIAPAKFSFKILRYFSPARVRPAVYFRL